MTAQCDVCNVQTLCNTEMESNVHTCPKCNSSFTTNRALTVHIANPPKKCIAAYKRFEFLAIERNKKPPRDDDERDHLFDKFVKVGTKQLIDRDPLASVFDFHQNLNLSDADTHKLLIRSKHEMTLLNVRHEKDALDAQRQVMEYQGKYGVHNEDIAYFNDCNDASREKLEKIREYLVVKMAIIDVHLIQRSKFAEVVRGLQQFFADDYIKRLQSNDMTYKGRGEPCTLPVNDNDIAFVDDDSL